MTPTEKQQLFDLLDDLKGLHTALGEVLERYSAKPDPSDGDIMSRLDKIEKKLNGDADLEDDDQYLTAEEVANMLRISRTSLYNMVSRGELPRLQPGKKLLFEKSDILRYMNKKDEPQKEVQPKKKLDPIDDYLTVGQLTKILHLSRASIYSKASRGELPSVKPGNKLLFIRSEIAEYIKGSRRSTSERVYRLSKTGLTDQEIAAKLGLGVGAVNKHIRDYKKGQAQRVSG